VHYEHEQEAAPARKAFVIIQCWPQMPLVEVTVELGNFRPYVSSWQEVGPSPTSSDIFDMLHRDTNTDPAFFCADGGGGGGCEIMSCYLPRILVSGAVHAELTLINFDLEN